LVLKLVVSSPFVEERAKRQALIKPDHRLLGASDSGLLVGAPSLFEFGPPGLARAAGGDVMDGVDPTALVAVGIDFTGLTSRVARSSLEWLHERLAQGDVYRLDAHEEEVELIRDPIRITCIMDALAAKEARGFAMAVTNGAGPGPSAAARLSIDGTLLVTAFALGPPPYQVELEGFHSVYQFTCTEVEPVERPDSMVRVRRRRHLRARAPRRLRVSFKHPLWEGIYVETGAYDVSLEGMSFYTDAVRDLLYPGLTIRDLELHWKGGVALRCDAVVAHVTQQRVAGQHRVGLRLSFAPASRSRWSAALEGVFHPRTRRAHSDPSPFWNAYNASGYFCLSGKRAEDFTGMRAAFERTHAILARSPEIGAAFSTSSERRVEAVAHQITPWDGSYLYYQFCRLPEQRPLSVADDAPLLELYSHAYGYVQERPDARFLVTYVQSVARFSRVAFHGIAQRYAADGRASISRFRAVEMSTLATQSASDKFEIGAPAPIETGQLLHAILSSRPSLVVQATGLTPGELTQERTVSVYRAAGLERRRELLIARLNGRAYAGAVLDSVDDGLHLFGLLDAVRIFPLTVDGCLAYPALLEAVRAWYRAQGKARFTYFADDPEDPDAVAREGAEDLGLADMIIMPVELLPELLEHLFVLTTRRGFGSRPDALESDRPRA
jgi:hypothetical protein